MLVARQKINDALGNLRKFGVGIDVDSLLVRYGAVGPESDRGRWIMIVL